MEALEDVVRPSVALLVSHEPHPLTIVVFLCFLFPGRGAPRGGRGRGGAGMSKCFFMNFSKFDFVLIPAGGSNAVVVEPHRLEGLFAQILIISFQSHTFSRRRVHRPQRRQGCAGHQEHDPRHLRVCREAHLSRRKLIATYRITHNHNLTFLSHQAGESKVEYRVWNPFRSKLAAAILGGVEAIHIKPGAKVNSAC